MSQKNLLELNDDQLIALTSFVAIAVATLAGDLTGMMLGAEGVRRFPDASREVRDLIVAAAEGPQERYAERGL